MLPTTRERIEDEERRIGMRLSDALRSRLLEENGGSLAVAGDSWDLNPVWDPTSRRTAGSSAGHIERETQAARDAKIGLPADAVVIASNVDGDMLLLWPSGEVGIWRLREFRSEPAAIDWTSHRNLPARRQPRLSAIMRIENELDRLPSTPGAAVVARASRTRAQLHFELDGDEIVARVTIARALRQPGSSPREQAGSQLRRLGWLGPEETGAWVRRWAVGAWDPRRVAILAVDTLTTAFGSRPNAIIAATEPPS